MNKDELVKKLCAKSYSFATKWKGYDVYSLFFGENAVVGLPMFILEKDGKCRLTETNEAFEIIEILPEK